MVMRKLNRDHRNESAEQRHGGVILHLCVLFIYLFSEDGSAVTLDLSMQLVG